MKALLLFLSDLWSSMEAMSDDAETNAFAGIEGDED